MSKELQASKPKLIEKFAGKFGVDPDKMLVTLKNTCFKGNVSNEQMMALLIVADQYDLNPWTREIYAYPDKNNGIVPVVGVDGWCRIINEHPSFDGVEFNYGPNVGNSQNHEYIEAVIYRKDRTRPTIVREFWSEVSKNTGPWQSHPRRMHRHKALIQCARIAFGFAGIFDPDEAKVIVGEREINPAGDVQPSTNSAKAKIMAAMNKEPIAAEVIDYEDFGPEPEKNESAPITAANVILMIESAATKEDIDLILDLSNSLPPEERATVEVELGKKFPDLGMSF